MSPIAERVRDARELRGMTKAQLAKSAKVSRGYLSQLESSDESVATIKEPGVATLEALAGALDVTKEWLAFGTGPAPKGLAQKRKRAS